MGQPADEAKQYLNERQIPHLFESLMTGLMYNRPEEPIEFMLAALGSLKENPEKNIEWDMFIDNPPEVKEQKVAPKRKSSKSVARDVSTPLKNVGLLTVPSLPTIILFGGPGGRKTEHAKRIAEHYKDEGMIHISIPELVNKAMHKYGSKFKEWKDAKKVYGQGQLIADEMIMGLLKTEMRSNVSAKSFLLEGFPANMEQAKTFEKEGGQVNMAIILDLDEESLVENTMAKGRTSAVAKSRIDDYKAKTLPAAKYYDDKFLLHLVPGEQDNDSVFEEMRSLVDTVLHPGANKPASQDISILPKDIPVLIVIGAPGSMKGEYCKRIVKRYDGFTHISLGERLRDKVENGEPREKWEKFIKVMKAGDMIPNQICEELVWEAIFEKPDSWGYVVEGFPRDLEQAKEFEYRVSQLSGWQDLVLLVDCTEQYCLKTLKARTDLTEGRRIDDDPDAIKQRIAVFKERTLPMLKYFDEKSKLKVIEGDKGVDKVFQDVVNILDTELFLPGESPSGKSLEE